MNTRTTYQIEKEMAHRLDQIRNTVSETELAEYRMALTDLASEYASASA